VNASRDAIWSWRPDGTILSWNGEAERLFGYDADEIVGQSIYTLIPRELHERASAAIGRLREGDWYGQYETLRVRKDGQPVHVELTVSPIVDETGETVAIATLCRDITWRKEAEEARQRLVAIVDSSEDAIVAKNLDGTITSWNRGAERLFGYAAEEVLGRSITIIIPPDRRDEETRILGRIRRGERVEPYDTVRQRKDGSLLDVSLTVSPVKDAAGRVLGASKIARDITERKRAEEARQFLTRELDHRVKNTLAIVQAMANQTFGNVPRARQALHAYRGRLSALAAAHDLLTRESWKQAPLEELVAQAVDVSGHKQRVEVNGPPVMLEPRMAVTVSLALHELCTNALKYGSLSNEAGTVSIDWCIAGAPERLELTWRERNGPPVTPPDSQGFGMLMLENLLSQHLDGSTSLAFHPEGLVCTLSVPLT
jgi:PAS domain S-box-containing protein